MSGKSAFVKLAEEVKDLGWESIKLNKEGFRGAGKTYRTDKGDVAVGFSMFAAFIVQDDEGLFSVQDLQDGIFKSNDFDISNLYGIDGAEVIADITEDGEASVGYDDELIAELGLNTPEIMDDIAKRLTVLRKLGESDIQSMA
jgi:hypothetical protein